MKKDVRSLTKIALVAALYVVLSLVLGNLSYGPIQFRIAEMLAFLVLIDKKYIYAVTLGCFLANLTSPLGIADIIFGTLSSLCALEIVYHIAKRFNSLIAKLCFEVFILVLFMIPVSIELTLILHVPFWLTLAQTMLGELVVTSLGAVLFYIIYHKRFVKRGESID